MNDWQVSAHQPIEKLTENLWRVEGSLPNMELKRVMSVAKLGDGRLVVHNAIALEEPAMAELDRFGEVAFVIVPNAYHRLDAPRFAKRYPHARVLCPTAATKAVAKKVTVHGDYTALPADPKVKLAVLDGVAGREGVMTVRSDDGGTLVFNDVVFNMPHLPGVVGWVLKNVTQSSGGPRISRLARWGLVSDRAAMASALRTLADTPELRRIVVSHHQTITDAPADTLRAVAATV